MKRFIKIAQCIFFMLILCSVIMASPNKKKKSNDKDAGTTITLVTSGTGNSKEEATKNALRSALEQTYGTFVSSSSQVVNDELVRDEIVSISTGNIVSYKELSFIDSKPKQVTVEAVVSITKLQNYAQNKGMSAELAGNTFAMNLKMQELNKKNQDVALKHLLEQTKQMSLQLFDYELSVGNPEKTPEGVQVPVIIYIKANKNTLSYYDLFHNTLSSLAINKGNHQILNAKQGLWIRGFREKGLEHEGIFYEFRGEYTDSEPRGTLLDISRAICKAVLNCEIVDNLGNVSGFEKKNKSSDGGFTRDYVTTNKLLSDSYYGTRQWPKISRGLAGYRNDYKVLSQIDYLDNFYEIDFWLNPAKPRLGENLYATKLFLMYSVDEIAKVSKIEIRPAQ